VKESQEPKWRVDQFQEEVEESEKQEEVKESEKQE